MLIGDSSGNTYVYNILNGAILKVNKYIYIFNLYLIYNEFIFNLYLIYI